MRIFDGVMYGRRKRRKPRRKWIQNAEEDTCHNVVGKIDGHREVEKNYEGG